LTEQFALFDLKSPVPKGLHHRDEFISPASEQDLKCGAENGTSCLGATVSPAATSVLAHFQTNKSGTPRDLTAYHSIAKEPDADR
jgi:hypothetical protein